MKVSELAERTKVSVHRLRRYEAQGLIIAERNASGYREFSDRTVREVIFIAMSRDLGFSLKDVGETLPSYRAGTLTFDQMVEHMQTRIAEVDAHIAAQRLVRAKLVSHIAWLKKRKSEFAKRGQVKPASSARPPWPTLKKEKR
jgi:MerR family transcriptional regulator, copper efflux regulator